MPWKPSGPNQRQPRALVVGLRHIVKDPKANVAQRLRACELLATIAGFIEARIGINAQVREALESTATRSPARAENINRLKQLLGSAREQKPGEGLPDAAASSLRQ